jgi:hypothetical protein
MAFPCKHFWAALLVAVALPALAQVSRDQAAAQAQQQTGGRVLSVERSDTGTAWRVKVVTASGEVLVVRIAAGTQLRMDHEETRWTPDTVLAAPVRPSETTTRPMRFNKAYATGSWSWRSPPS